MNMPMGDNSTSDFCTGGGRVMFAGFQQARGETAACALFLFEGWVLNSAVKYAFAVIGTFLLGCANEGFVQLRKAVAALMSRRGNSRTATAAVCALIYGVHMFCAYCMMLLVSARGSIAIVCPHE